MIGGPKHIFSGGGLNYHKECKLFLQYAALLPPEMSTEAEQQLLHDARNGNCEEVRQLLETMDKEEVVVDINCKGRSKSNLGWTPLHLACYFGHGSVVKDLLKEVVMLLLQYDADTSIVNGGGQTARDVTQDKEINNMLEDQTPFDLAQGAEMKQILGGSIGKSLRFFGWKLYWVVLEHGVLSWYCKQADAVNNDHRQGCKHLTQAVCTNWLVAIEDHSAYSTHYCTQEQLSDEEDDDTVSVAELQETLKKAQTCQQRLDKEISNFLIMIKSCNTTKGMPPSFLQKIEVVSEVSKETCEALSNCLKLFTKQEGVRNLKLEHEQEKNKILSEALETLATEHHELEQSLVKGSPPLSILSEEQFYDAVSDSESEKSLSGFETVTTYSEDSVESNNTITSSMSEEKVCGGGGKVCGGGGESLSNGIKKHRTSLPSPMFSRNDFSIWSILRKCIGMCVAAFAVSAVASQWERTGKPFNPLLGETYELVSKKKVCALYGKWTECLYSVDPATFEAYKKNDKKNTEEKKNSKQMYNFTSFAMALNELDKEMESVVPKTDCRLRPDIRAMENGEIDLASEEKKRLEEKQRAVRKNRSKSEEDWKTRWFHQGPNPYTGAQDWLYSGNYWDRNYFNLPDIY
ncbi:unnamed protein product [Caretta caretta]